MKQSISEIRISQYLSTTFVANTINVDEATYLKYENTTGNIPFCDLLKIAKLFGCSVHDIDLSKNAAQLSKDELAIGQLYNIAHRIN